MIPVTFNQVSQMNVLSMAISFATIEVVSSAIELLAAMVTPFRLGFRLRIRRFWWEDAWAAVAMIAAMTFAGATLISLTEARNPGIAYIANQTCSYAFTSTVWSVRMSLLYSIVRIAPPSTWLRNFMRVIGALFVIFWALMVALKTWRCEDGSTCILPFWMAIFELTADFAGDATLVILSLRLLWKVKLPRRQRKMILLSFTSNVFISMSSLLHAIAQTVYTLDGHLVLILTNLELISCLIVCNLLVVVTYIYRVYVSSSESESSSADDDFTTPITRTTTRSLTTVDLNAFSSISNVPGSTNGRE